MFISQKETSRFAATEPFFKGNGTKPYRSHMVEKMNLKGNLSQPARFVCGGMQKFSLSWGLQDKAEIRAFGSALPAPHDCLSAGGFSPAPHDPFGKKSRPPPAPSPAWASIPDARR